jgi:hypothetical protein
VIKVLDVLNNNYEEKFHFFFSPLVLTIIEGRKVDAKKKATDITSWMHLLHPVCGIVEIVASCGCLCSSSCCVVVSFFGSSPLVGLGVVRFLIWFPYKPDHFPSF